MNFTATYSPDDNKLRLYASSRLPTDLYERVKAAGFRWAPKQEVFVAPMWTPARADLCEELAGEIDDEDTSLIDRAEQRAERFEDYSASRKADYASAQKEVSAIADNIPFGQPILIGHHSERHARKDAERIENGMRKAVKMWETAQYWTSRAAGAIHHAKYKELPAVRARRIKGIEADMRAQLRQRSDFVDALHRWNKEGLTLEQARNIANVTHLTVTRTNADGTPNTNSGWTAYDVLRADGERYKACPSCTVAQVLEAARAAYPRGIAYCDRWIQHYENRLNYERAMLAESGGLVSDKNKFEIGGKVLRRGEWFTITRVNPGSVSVRGHFASTVTFDEIKDYQAPTAEQSAAVAKASKIAPLCNYPGEGFKHMTTAEFETRKERNWSDFPKTKYINGTDTIAIHRVRCARGDKQWDSVMVYLTDGKRKDPPARIPDEPTIPKPERAISAPVQRSLLETSEEDTQVQAMKDTLRAGVKVITAPQLFPTPKHLAVRAVELAAIDPSHRVLEPSAGTGALLDEIYQYAGSEVVAVEINRALGERLQSVNSKIVIADFLQCNGDLGTFDRIVMNPPFEQGSDIKHITHALTMLKPGGRLVAICANGPRQREQLMPLADLWEDLPADTFKAAGTSVNTALLVIEA